MAARSIRRRTPVRASAAIRLLILLTLLLASAREVGAQGRPHTPARGSAERQALMDALRETVRRELGKPAIFGVNELRVLGDWAFADVSPRNPDGTPLDYRGTPLEAAQREGMAGDGMYALLRRQNGRWWVVRHAIGPTDVAWIPWEEELHAPRAIFPYPDQ